MLMGWCHTRNEEGVVGTRPAGEGGAGCRPSRPRPAGSAGSAARTGRYGAWQRWHASGPARRAPGRQGISAWWWHLGSRAAWREEQHRRPAASAVLAQQIASEALRISPCCPSRRRCLRQATPSTQIQADMPDLKVGMLVIWSGVQLQNATPSGVAAASMVPMMAPSRG